MEKLFDFYHPSPFELYIIFKEYYFTAHVEINYHTGCLGSFCIGKTQRCIQDHRDSFQLVTNFTNNPSRGAIRVLNVPLEYYNVF